MNNKLNELVNLYDNLEELKRKNQNILYSSKEVQQLVIDVYNKFLSYDGIKELQKNLQFKACYSSIIIDYSTVKLIQKNLIDENRIYTKQLLITQQHSENQIDEVIKLLEKSCAILNTIKSHDYSYPNLVASIVKRLKKLALNKLGTLYALYIDVEKGINYNEQAAKQGSLHSLSFLTSIYTQEEYFDIDKANYYFNEIITSQQDSYEKGEHSFFKYASCLYLCRYYADNGIYHECISIIEKTIASNLIETHKEELKKEIEKYKEKIDELNNVKTKDDNLKKYFSDKNITHMSNDIKILIETSLHMYEYINSFNENNNSTLDYSSCTMPIMKALEAILYDVFAIKYLQFLKEIDNPDLNKIDKSLKNYKGTLNDKITHIEYGSVLNISAKTNFYNNQKVFTPNEYFISFCKKLNIENPESFIIDFCEKLDYIKSYRNKSAHMNRITKSDAEESLNYLIINIKFIEFAYNSFYK